MWYKVHRGECHMTTEVEILTRHIPKARNAKDGQQHQKLDKKEERMLPLSLQGEYGPANIWVSGFSPPQL